MEIFGSYSGTDFLVFYAVMLVTAMFCGMWIAANLRAQGTRSEVSDMEEAAVLSGGIVRHAMAVSSDLLARKGLTTGSKGHLRVSDAGIDTSAAGRSILNHREEIQFSQLQLATASTGREISERLTSKGLLMTDTEQLKLRWLSVLPYLALLTIGVYRYQAGNAAGEPTGMLLVLLVLTLALGLVRFIRLNPRTIAGNDVLHDLEVQASRMRLAPAANEAGFAVALFGTAVLVGTPWEPVHAMRANSGGGDGTGSDNDGGDSGCGGGGCGGCGG